MNGQGNQAGPLSGTNGDYVHFVPSEDTQNDQNNAASAMVTSPATNTIHLSNGRNPGGVTTPTSHASRRPPSWRHQRAFDHDGVNPPSPPPRPSDPSVVARARNMLKRLGTRNLSPQLSDPGPMQRQQSNVDKTKRRSDLILHQATKKVVLAIYDYNPTNEDDLTFKRGDVLEVLRDGYLWWFARNPITDKVGYAPKNHVKPYTPMVDSPFDDNQTGDREDFFSRLSFAVSGPGSGMAIAVCDNESHRKDELDFQAGDVFIVLNDARGWWYARHLKTKTDGFIRRCQVKPLEAMEDRTGETFSI